MTVHPSLRSSRARALPFVAAAALALPAAAGAAALQQLSTASGEIRALLNHPAPGVTIYAGTQGGGVHKSLDGGNTWGRLTGLPARYVWQLAGGSDTQVVYAATSEGMWRTPDGGMNWSRRIAGDVRAVAVDPTNGSRILVGVRGAGIELSTDGGNTFARSSNGLDSWDVTAIAFHPTSAGVVYAGLQSRTGLAVGGVFRSTDGGATWASWNNPGGAGAIGSRFVTCLVVDDAGQVLAGTFDGSQNSGTVYRQNGLANGAWSASHPNLFGVESLHVDRASTSEIWVGTRFLGPWRSDNDGASLQQLSSDTINPAVCTNVYSFATFSASPTLVYIGVRGAGLYATSTNGASWVRHTGPRADRARTLVASANGTLYLGLDGGGVWSSTNSGASWTGASAGLETSIERVLTVNRLAASASNASLLYAATNARGLFRFNGTTWSKVTESGINETNVFVKPQGVAVNPSNDAQVLYSVFDPGGGVYRRNANATWTKTLTLPGAGNGAGPVVLSPNFGSNGRTYELTYDDTMRRSTDSGGTWSEVGAGHLGFMRLAFWSLQENPTNTNIVLGSTNKGVYVSTDAGASFTAVGATGLASTVLTGIAYIGGTAWGVDRAGGLYCTTNNGTSWSARSDGALGRSAMLDVRAINGDLFLLTDGDGVLWDSAPTCP